MHIGDQPGSGALGVAHHLRRSAVALGVLGLLGGAAGWLAGGQLEEPVTARATVLLNPLEGNAFYPGGQGEELIRLETEAQLVGADDVATAVAEATGSSDARALLDGLAVTVHTNTQILQIEYVHDRASVAEERAQAFADAYLAYRERRAQTLLTQQEEHITAEVADRSAELEALAAEFEAEGSESPRANLLTAQIQTVTSQISQLNARLTDLAATPVDPGRLVTPAEVQRPGLLQTKTLAAGAGAALGVGLGAALVYLRARGGRFRLNAEGVRVAGLDVLATVHDRRTPGDEPTAHWSTLHVTEEHRQLRAVLLRTIPPGPDGAFLLLGLDPVRPDASAAPLALGLARSGVRTVLIDVAGHQPEMSSAGDESRPGVSDVLLGQSALEDALVTAEENLRVLPVGSADLGTQDHFVARQAAELLSGLGETDMVIVASDGLDSLVAQSVARAVPRVVLEVRAGRTRTGQLAAAVDWSASMDCQIVGVILVRRPRLDLGPRLLAFVRRRIASLPHWSFAPKSKQRDIEQPSSDLDDKVEWITFGSSDGPAEHGRLDAADEEPTRTAADAAAADADTADNEPTRTAADAATDDDATDTADDDRVEELVGTGANALPSDEAQDRATEKDGPGAPAQDDDPAPALAATGGRAPTARDPRA